MSVSSINCVSCGAPVHRRQDQNTLMCSYCGCQLHYSPRKHIELEDLSSRASDESDISNEIFLINTALDDGNHWTVYEQGIKLTEKEPALGLGYFYAAHGLFWSTAGPVVNASEYFQKLENIVDLLKTARNLTNDIGSVVQLEEDIIFNLCSVANRQGRSDFVGSNIQQSFQLFLHARSLDKDNVILLEVIGEYCTRLTDWSAQQLEEESRQSKFTPNAAYLEYIYYCWKHFGVLNGIEAFKKHSKAFTKNSSNEKTVAQILGMRDEIIQCAETKKPKAGMFGFFK